MAKKPENATEFDELMSKEELMYRISDDFLFGERIAVEEMTKA